MSNVNQYTKFAVSWGTATDGEPRSPFASLPATVALLEAPPIRVPAHYIKGKRGGRFYACRGEKGCSPLRCLRRAGRPLQPPLRRPRHPVR